MKRIISVLCLFLIVSCAKDVVDLSGDILGVVKDYQDGHLISNCQVSLTPSGKMTSTDNVGKYEFLDIEPGEYTLVFSKAGYTEEFIKVEVVTGQVTEASIMLKIKSPFSLSESSLDFGDLETNKSVMIYNNTDSDCNYSISNTASWMSLSTTQGTLKPGANGSVNISIDRESVDYGEFSQSITFSYSGSNNSGAENLIVKFKKVKLSVPTVSCAAEATNITETSFDIGGDLKATGGQTVTSYGHCWSMTPNPTIADNRTNNGSTQATGEFKSTLTGLTTFTTYYVRAYAENEMGISYSEEVSVTTPDAKSEKWDGSIASSFAGGTGTSANPYIIENGGHLLLMRDYADAHFALANNINLDNINWKPFAFSGTFDGKGYTISNLYIKRNDDYQGLFSKVEQNGKVRNLTIKGVKIDGSKNDYVGVIAGSNYYSNYNYNYGEISNCKVIFISDSFIKGDDYVGGITGQGDALNCEVLSQSAGTVITGDQYVGGISGNGTCEICHVSADILGSIEIGGITGSGSCAMCSFNGIIGGGSHIGGIAGYALKIISCRANADISCTEKGAGGIAGCLSNSSSIIASYSNGTISASSATAEDLGGIFGTRRDDYGVTSVKHSYSTVISKNDNFDGFGDYCSLEDCCTITTTDRTGTNTQSNCTDITTFMKECYSDYAEYWNFNNTWTWKGTINGEEVSVSCPKLAWER